MSSEPVTDTSELAEPWRAWGRQRPPTQVIHLDVAASGRTSFAVQHAVSRHMRRESEIGAYPAQAEAGHLIDRGRSQLAALLGIAPHGIAFVESATAALTTLLSTWPLPAAAVIGVAPSEWGSNLRAMRMHGLAIRILDTDATGAIDVPALRDVLTSDPPSVVHVTASAAHRGLLQPVDDIVAACHEHGTPVWLDVAQGLGQIDVASAADAVYATSRKWLCGPRGVGVLGVADPWWHQLTAEPLALNPHASPIMRLESDEANVAGRLGLCTAVQEYLDIDPAALHQRLTDLARTTRELLAEVPGWRVVPAAAEAGAIVAISSTHGQDIVTERQRLLDEHGILVTASQPSRAPHDSVGPTLRVSPHVDTTPAQLAALAVALAATPTT